jgi:hypothetical protein
VSVWMRVQDAPFKENATRNEDEIRFCQTGANDAAGPHQIQINAGATGKLSKLRSKSPKQMAKIATILGHLNLSPRSRQEAHLKSQQTQAGLYLVDD